MGDWPRTYDGNSAPPEVLAIAERLMPCLLAGDNPALAVVREQYGRARIESVELTGAGFFVNYAVPPEMPKTSPPTIIGGSASLHINRLENGAGCLVFVRDGYLQMFEVYIYDPEWPEDARLLGVDSVVPLEVTGSRSRAVQQADRADSHGGGA